MPLKENEILDQVEAYVAGQIPLRALSVWLHELACDMEDLDASPRTQAFAYTVLAKVSERYSSGAPESALRVVLDRLARTRREDLDRIASVITQRVGTVQLEAPTQTSSGGLVLEEEFQAVL
jgi:hypothetical protein